MINDRYSEGDTRWFGITALQGFFRISNVQAQRMIDCLHGSRIIEQDPDAPWEYRFVKLNNMPATELIKKLYELSDASAKDPLVTLEEIRSE